MRRLAVLSAVFVFCCAATGRAQSEAVVGLGLAMSTHDPTGPLGIGTSKVGPLLRLRLSPDGGFGPAVGFDWHTVGAEVRAGDQQFYLGRVRLKPIMGGVAYTRLLGRYSVVASVVAGYAFARLTLHDTARAPLRNALDATSLGYRTKGSLAWRPQIQLWYEAAPRVGLMASLAYLGTRPTVSITGDGGTLNSRLQTASTVVSFGLVYGVF